MSPEPNHPTTSISTWALPALTCTFTLPPAPMRATTRFGTVWPGAKLRFDTLGNGSPVGHTVMNP